jgi:hypothetical protein
LRILICAGFYQPPAALYLEKKHVSEHQRYRKPVHILLGFALRKSMKATAPGNMPGRHLILIPIFIASLRRVFDRPAVSVNLNVA